MKRLSYKLIVILIILVLIKVIVVIAIPETLTDDLVDRKWTGIYNRPKVNTLFVGTSRIRDGIRPTVIDSITPILNSYNFGIAQLTMPYLTDAVLEGYVKKESNIQFILIELTGPHFEVNNISRGFQFYLNSGSMQAHQLLFELFNNLKRRVPELMGMRSEILTLTKSIVAGKSDFVNDYLQFNNAGYEDQPSKIPWNQETASRQNSLTKSTYQEAFDINIRSIGDFANLQGIHSTFDSLGVKVIFMLPPLVLANESEYVLNSYRSLNKDQRLVIDTSAHFRLIEDFSLRKDANHFNHRGAGVYSQIIANALKSMLLQN